MYSSELLIFRNPQEFNREARPADFDRFRTYAARVTRMEDQRLRALGDPKVHTGVWDQLEQHRGEYAFPRLRSIIYRCRARPYPVFLAVVPLLEMVILIDIKATNHSQECVSRFLNQLASTPSLEILKVRADKYATHKTLQLRVQHLSLPLATATSTLKNLTSVEIPEIPLLPSCLANLALMPSLIRMSILVRSCDYGWGCLSGTRASYSACFVRLKFLEIFSDSFDWCAAFFRAFALPSLEIIRIITEDIVASLLFWDFATALATRPSADKRLMIIDLLLGKLPLNETYQRGAPVYLSRQLTPLFALSALRYITIRGYCHMVLDDDALESISRAWPKLTNLFLEPTQRPRDDVVTDLPAGAEAGPQWAPATLFGLSHIAERCHTLRSLGLVLNLETMPTASELRRALERLAAQDTPCPLLDLSVGWSVLGDHVRLASALSAWFPALVKITDARFQPWAGEGGWELVASKLPENVAMNRKLREAETLARRFARIRAQERDRRKARSTARERIDGSVGADCTVEVNGVRDGLAQLRP